MSCSCEQKIVRTVRERAVSQVAIQAKSFSEPAPPVGGLRVFAGWLGARASGRIAANPREFWHAKVKHLSAKQGLLFLTGCSFSPQPNVSVKPTPTSFTCGFPARFALRCGLPVALGSRFSYFFFWQGYGPSRFNHLPFFKRCILWLSRTAHSGQVQR
jgi:hypothetical protein